MSSKKKPLLYDQEIINRVQKCLEDNVEDAMNDIGFITRQLQKTYPEYRRRKQGAFRKLVKQAYQIVSDKLLEDMSPLSSEESSADEAEDEVAAQTQPSNNLMKNMLNRMYNKQPTLESSSPKAAPPTGTDPITISSDESQQSLDAGPSYFERENYTREPMYSSDASTDNSLNSTFGNDALSTNNAQQSIDETSQNSSLGLKRSCEMNSEDMHSYKKVLKRTSESNSRSSVIDENQFQHNEQNTATNANQNPLKDNLNKSSNRRFKKVVKLKKSALTFDQFGGIEGLLKQLCEILIQFQAPDIYSQLGVTAPSGLLLHGPSGCGKTSLAYAIAGQLNLPIIPIAAPELIGGISGESEERIREVFEQAVIMAPCVLFFDEIDVISTNRQFAGKDMERRIVSQLISSMDTLKLAPNREVIFIGATSRPDSLDPALRRVGRFDYELAIPIPNRKERKDILRIICDGLNIEKSIDFDKIAELTPGYVGADLSALVSRSAMFAVNRSWSKYLHNLQAKQNVPVVDLDELEKDPDNSNQNLNESEVLENVNGTGVEMDGLEDAPLANVDEPENSNINEDNEKVSKDTNEVTDVAATTATDTDEVIDAVTDAVTDTATDTDTDTATTVVEVIQNSENNVLNNNKPIEPPASPTVEMRSPTLTEMINFLYCPPEISDLQDIHLTFNDFLKSIKMLKPSAKREGFITVPNVCWDDIGSLHDIREELRLAILAPVKYPQKMLRLGLSVPSGVLLCGPPGCGKTLIAKAIANEAGINFISVKGPELMNLYVGESERAVRDCFQRARNSAPCVIFFDEFDSLCPKRSNAHDGSSGVRIVNQLLTEMDGIEERKGVYIMAATNRPDIIDPAVLRPGRLDTILYVGMPNVNDRIEILTAATKNRTNPVLAEDVDFAELASYTEGFSGADLNGLIRQASMLALRNSLTLELDMNELLVRMADFREALRLVRPSISDEDCKIYDKLREKYAAPRFATTAPKITN